MSTTIRLFWEKRDRAKYISHLDITRCFARAIARTDIPVWYTEGFNPRIYMTFPLPISLGYEGGCESLDIRLTDESFPLEEVTRQLSAVLPEGIKIIHTALPIQKPEAIALADYIIKVECADSVKLKRDFIDFADSETIIVTKKTKKGNKELDIKPLIEILSAEPEAGTLVLTLRLAAGTTMNLSPSLVMDAYAARIGNDGIYYRVERIAILTAERTPWQ